MMTHFVYYLCPLMSAFFRIYLVSFFLLLNFAGIRGIVSFDLHNDQNV